MCRLANALHSMSKNKSACAGIGSVNAAIDDSKRNDTGEFVGYANAETAVVPGGGKEGGGRGQEVVEEAMALREI